MTLQSPKVMQGHNVTEYSYNQHIPRVLAILRCLLVLGCFARIGVHYPLYRAAPFGLDSRFIWLTATLAYILPSLYLYLKRNAYEEMRLFFQIGLDSTYVVINYALSAAPESDLHLAFVIPLLTATELMKTRHVVIALSIIILSLLIGLLLSLYCSRALVAVGESRLNRPHWQMLTSVLLPRVAFWAVVCIPTTWLIWASDLAISEKQFYRSLFEALPHHVFRKDTQGKFTYASPGFCRCANTTEDALIGLTDHHIYPKVHADAYRSDDLKVMDGNPSTIQKVEDHYDVSSGQLRAVHVYKTSLKDREGKVSGVLGLFWEVEAREIEQGKMLRWFLHDTPKPLHLVRDHLVPKILLCQQKGGERLLEIPTICEKIDDAIRFVSAQFLAYGILGGGRFEWRTQDPIKPERLLKPITNIIRQDNAGINFKFHDRTKDFSVQSDSVKLAAVLWVLVDNACSAIRKRCGQGSPAGNVTIDCRLEEDTFSIVVTDDGCGIDLEHAILIKEALRRNSSTSTFGRTGFGLRILDRFAQMANGRWDFSSDGLGCGTRFTFSLPVQAIRTRT